MHFMRDTDITNLEWRYEGMCEMSEVVRGRATGCPDIGWESDSIRVCFKSLLTLISLYLYSFLSPTFPLN